MSMSLLSTKMVVFEFTSQDEGEVYLFCIMVTKTRKRGI